MRVSLNWIKRILNRQDLGLSVADLQARLTLHLAEFEADVEVAGPKLDGVVVGKVLTCIQHPNADRLRCTTVDIGTGTPIQVVCGAPNVAAGQTVAVATIGTQLTMSDWHREAGFQRGADQAESNWHGYGNISSHSVDAAGWLATDCVGTFR